ncbi:MAG: hypothetical protein K6C95_10125 [Lachnospiraceae bacterium]|nr:hypothetical protein [Lachnospiraceae bacterium]
MTCVLAVLLMTAATAWFAGAFVVQSSLMSDINGNGQKDMILLVWKYGSFGKHRPSWIKEDTTGLSQHIFIYEKRSDGWHPIWMSSALGMRIDSIREGDEIRGTGRPSLVIAEKNGRISRWGWLHWGLVNID